MSASEEAKRLWRALAGDDEWRARLASVEPESFEAAVAAAGFAVTRAELAAAIEELERTRKPRRGFKRPAPWRGPEAQLVWSRSALPAETGFQPPKPLC